MAKHNSKYPGKCLEWKARLSQQESSGKTIEAWCEENSISIRTFFRWKERLLKEPPIITEPPITPTQLQPVITANAPKTLSDVYAEYCEKGRSDRAYATRCKQAAGGKDVGSHVAHRKIEDGAEDDEDICEIGEIFHEVMRS